MQSVNCIVYYILTTTRTALNSYLSNCLTAWLHNTLPRNHSRRPARIYYLHVIDMSLLQGVNRFSFSVCLIQGFPLQFLVYRGSFISKYNTGFPLQLVKRRVSFISGHNTRFPLQFVYNAGFPLHFVEHRGFLLVNIIQGLFYSG